MVRVGLASSSPPAGEVMISAYVARLCPEERRVPPGEADADLKQLSPSCDAQWTGIVTEKRLK